MYDAVLENMNQDRDERIQELSTEIPADQKDRLSMQAKSYHFCLKTGNIFNIEDYLEWKQQQSSESQPKIQEQPIVQEVKKVEELKTEEEEPEYSSNYQNVVEKIIKGEPIPGIKQIPDTVLEGQSSTSKADMRKKPWELAKEEQEDKEDLEKEEKLNQL